MCGIIGGFLGSCCASMFCRACASCEPSKTGPMSRIPYLFILVLSGVVAVVMSLYGEQKLDLKFDQISCSNCAGNGSVFRISMVLFFFELMHVLFILGGAVAFHYKFFLMKLFLYAGAVVLTFFVGSNTTYDNFGEFARYVPAPLFLVLQVLLLITWAYDLNDSIKTKINEKNQNKWYGLLLVLSLSLFVLSFVLLGLFFGWYANGSDCRTHETLISLSLIFAAANFFVSIWSAQGTFFVSAMVSAYTTFLCFGALQSDSVEQCNEYFNSRDTASLWIGVAFALLSLCYAALSSNLLQSLVKTNDPSEMNTALLDEKQDAETASSQKKVAKEGEEEQNYTEEADKKLVADSNYNDLEANEKTSSATLDNKDSITSTKAKREAVYFHVILTLAAGYMAMLLTNWGTNEAGQVGTSGRASLWANIACQWLTEILFLWTMIAPKVCPSRFAET